MSEVNSPTNDGNDSEDLIKFNQEFILKLTNQGNQIIERSAKQSCKIIQISTNFNLEPSCSAKVVQVENFPKRCSKVLRNFIPRSVQKKFYGTKSSSKRGTNFFVFPEATKPLVMSFLQPSDYPNLFIFIIQHQNVKFVNENQESKARQFEEFLIKFGVARPFVILHTFEAENETKFYYKAENSTQFVDIDQHYSEDLSLYEEYKGLLKSLLGQDLGSFEDQILKMLSWIKDSSIVLRFLRTLNIEEAYFGSIVLKIAENGSKADLLAVLDAQFEDHGRKLNNQAENYLRWVFDDDSSSEASDDVQSKEDSGSEISSDKDQGNPMEGTSSHSKNKYSGQSVLLTAVQHSNKEIIDYIMTYCTHLIQQLPVDHQIKVSTEAFNSKQFNVLCDLLEISDFPFPDEFTFSKSKINENLQRITKQRTELKDAIERGDIARIDNFIDNNLSHKFIYSIDNKSALTEAVKARQFGVFYYLKSLGFQGENCQEILAKLTKEERSAAVELATKQRKENIEKSLKNCHRSVYNLCGKSLIHNRKISKELEAKYRENIKQWFITVHKIGPEMLEVAASCENLKIIFDFESPNVESASLGSQYSAGAAYTTSKWIFIGAKFTDKVQQQNIKGVLAHELCHYVMALVYENQELPHYEQDNKTEEIFKEIVAILDKWSTTKTIEPDDECGGIISTVYRLYGSKDFGSELIVRVVNILAQFDDDRIKTGFLRQKYQILFDFWYNHVVPEMLNYLEKDKVAIRVNATVGILKSIANSEIEFLSSKKMEQLMENKVTIVTTNVPRLLFINIFSHLGKTCGCLLKSQNLFLDPEKIKNEQVWTDLKDLNVRNVKLNVFVDCTKEYLDNLKSIICYKEFTFILITTNEEQSSKLKKMCKKNKITTKMLDKIYSWSDLTEKSQKYLLETKINFQNYSDLPLIELLTRNTDSDKKEVLRDFSDIINDQILNFLIDKNEICLNSNFEALNNFEILYQKRQFLKKGVSFKNEISQEKLISITADSKYVLISDIAGSGKSWVVKNISKLIQNRTPTRWVTYVDLKEFIKEFKEKVQNFDFPSFFVENILKPKTEFEAKIFKKLYKIGKVSIIFDAFDEIAPDCAEFVADLAKSFKFNDGNQLWIVTRDYFEVNLHQKLGIDNVYKLSEFPEQEGINFIVASWILTDFKNQKEISYENFKQNSPNLTKYHEKATKIVQKVTVSKNQSIGLPQLFSMIADCFKDDNFNVDDLKRAKIFTQFVNKMYTRWADYKGILRKDESIKSQHYVLGFIKFHQYCAIASLFPELIDFLFPNYDKSEWSEAEIIACGIINKIGSSTYSFIHETFREFFVADFIFKSLKDPKITKLLIQVLTVKKFGVIRTFLNDFVVDYSVLKNAELELGKSVEKFYKMENFSKYFTENQEQLAKLVIEILKKGDYENVKIILIYNINEVATITKDLEIFLTFTDFIFSFLKDEDLMKIITDQNILHEMIESDQKIETFENFVEMLEKKFGSEFVQLELIKMPSINEIGNIFYHLGKSQNLSKRKVQKFFEIIQKYLNEDKIVELMKKCNRNGNTIFNILNRNSRNFKPFIDGADSYLIDRNLFPKLKNIVYKTDSNGQHILHFSAFKEGIEFHESLWNFIHKTYKNQDELAAFVLQKNCWQDNFLHVLIVKNKSDVIEFTLKELNEILKQSDYQEILRSKGQFGRNLLQLAAVFSKEVETHENFWKELRDSCKSDEEFLEILGEVDEDGSNVLGIAAMFSTADVLKFMQAELEKIGLKEKVKKLLTNLGFGRCHLLQAAALQNKSLELHKILWEILKNYFDSFEILEFFKHCDGYGNNLLLNAIYGNTKEVQKLTWNEVKEVLNRTELITEEQKEKTEKCEKIFRKVSDSKKLKQDEKEFLKLKWIKNENSKMTKLFDEATQKLIEQRFKKINLKNIEILQSDQNIENHRKLWQKCTETLNSREIIEKLATETNENGSIFLHLLIFYNTAEVIEFTLNKFEENLDESDYKKLLRSKGQIGRNLLQAAVVNSYEVKTHQILWKKLRDFCKSDEEFLEILGEVDNEGDNVLGLAATFSTGEILKFMHAELEKIGLKEEVKKLLTNLGFARRHLLEAAAYQNESLELHKILWKMLKKYFDSCEILEFIKHCDSFGYNLLLNAIKENTKDVQELTWIEIKQILKNVECKDENSIKLCEKIIKKVPTFDLTEEQKKILKLKWIETSSSVKLFESYAELLKKKLISIKSLKDLMPFVGYENIENHKILWMHLENKFNSCEELKELLMEKDEDGNNFIHLLLILNSTDVIKFTIDKVKENLNEKDYQEILRSKKEFGRNLLQVAAFYSKEVKTHQILWKEIQDSCKSDEKFMKILEEVDEEGNNIFHLAAAFTTSQVFKFMILELEKLQNFNELKKLLASFGKGNKNLLHSAVIQNKNLETHKTIWQIISKYFDTKEILEFIEHCDSDGDNLLCCAVYCNTKENVEFTWNKIKIFKNTKEEQFKYLNRKGQNDKNLHQLALENQESDSKVAVWVKKHTKMSDLISREKF